MPSAVAQVSDSAETTNIGGWLSLSLDSDSDRYVRQQRLRDPLKGQKFGVDVIAVFGIYQGDKGGGEGQLVYFWHQELPSLKLPSLVATSELAKSVAFGCELGRIQGRAPSLFALKGILSGEERFYVDGLGEDVDLFWRPFDGISMACLYRGGDTARVPTKGGRQPKERDVVHMERLENCLSFHFDYLNYRSPIWNAVPMRYLFNTAGLSNSAIIDVHLSPKCFNPLQEDARPRFLWPWQQCIAMRDGELRLAPLPTISLAFDLRRSTLAMEEIDDISEFSPFIERTVNLAKEIVFEFGGFFDKDTGDGIVAHFVDFSVFADKRSFPRYVPAPMRAFSAARKIVKEIAMECEVLQPKLRHGISSLGPSVGIHAGEAVWISDHKGVRAIGDSVVYAVRLCSNADTRSIFVSNSFLSRLGTAAPAEVAAMFQKKEYVGKEYGRRGELFGYSLTLPDPI